jgi:hypothetical protein
MEKMASDNDQHDFVSRADLEAAIKDAVQRGYQLGHTHGRQEENEACAVLAQRELLLNAGKHNIIGTLPVMIRARVA